jgi:hypothetical protein
MSEKRKSLAEMVEEVEWKKMVDKAVKEQFAMHDDTPLAKLFSLVGSHLTGLKVYARLREPYRKACRGMMLPSGNGRVTIDINPSQDLAGQYMTFLHEVAHVRHHFYDINTGSVLTEPGSVEVDYSKYSEPSVIKEEEQANEQARVWDAWASDPVRLREVGYHPDDPIELYKLKALSRIEVYYEEK